MPLPTAPSRGRAFAPPETEPAGSTNADLLRHVETQTYRQVRDLQIRCSGRRVRVTGTSKSFYVKQLVTHAIVATLPSVQLENEITVTRC
jgi:hypothetical protein